MTDRPSILVPIRVLEGESIADGVPELLADAHVVLLGYHVIPDQTAPGQAQMQFEERANKRLDEYEAIFEAAGATVERRLVFTHDEQKTLDRITDEHECLAVLVPNATRPPEDVLVAVRGTVGADHLSQAVAGLFSAMDVTVTLYHVSEEGDEAIRTLLEGVRDRLTELGMDRAAIELRIDSATRPLESISETAGDYDVVVMGESDPSLTTFVFGMPAEQIAERFLGPVLVVQREAPEPESS